MISRIISDEDLICATALVRESMLNTLPDSHNCMGQFTPQFEERIEKLKETAARNTNQRRLTKYAVAAALVILIGFSMLFVFNTEVRATVVNWFQETFRTHTTFWYTTANEAGLPVYELTRIPDDYEIVYDNTTINSRSIVFQHKENDLDAFTFSYCLAESDSKLFLDTSDGEYTIEKVSVKGFYGEFFRSQTIDESNALVWLDEDNNTILSIIAYFPKDELLQIACHTELAQ